MYQVLVKEYVKRLSLKDINDFANKNNIPIKNGEDKVIYDFIKNNWQDIYNSNDYNFNSLKGKISNELLHNIISLYNKYKKFTK